jgi:alkylated DNA repair dioxygenase AlkB
MECQKACVTYTFGEVAENHVGMQKIGDINERGFSKQDLQRAQMWFSTQGYKGEVIDLKEGLAELEAGLCEYRESVEEAYVLVVRRGVEAFTNPDALLKEAENLEWDTKAKMRGRVVNKRARYNLCFGDAGQEPDYEAGKGRIVALPDVPQLNTIRSRLEEVLGEAGRGLKVEGNLYYDTQTCGIGFHGDSERRKVLALRLGTTMPLHYQWYLRSQPIGNAIKMELHHGDLYIMSEKAVGTDWKRKIIPTLRHAAGADKYLRPSTAKPVVSTIAPQGGRQGEPKELSSLTVSELKDILRSKKLRVGGKKADLIARIRESSQEK